VTDSVKCGLNNLRSMHFGNYCICPKKCLGHGATGAVFECFDLSDPSKKKVQYEEGFYRSRICDVFRRSKSSVAVWRIS
jgi:hypothetical protein